MEHHSHHDLGEQPTAFTGFQLDASGATFVLPSVGIPRTQHHQPDLFAARMTRNLADVQKNGGEGHDGARERLPSQPGWTEVIDQVKAAADVLDDAGAA